MVECMLTKEKYLISVEDKNRRIPVVLAIEYKHKDLAWYLYNLTPRKLLKQGKGIHGATVCTRAIDNEMLGKKCSSNQLLVLISTILYVCNICSFIFIILCGYHIADIALDLIQSHPRLALAVDLDQRSPFYALASQRNTFSRLKWFALSKRRICFVHYFCNSFNHSGFKDSEKRDSLELLQCMCQQISISSYEDMTTGGVSSAVNLSIRERKFEFIDEIVKSNDAIKWRDNGNGRTILAIAILHRQAKIYRHLLNSLVKDPMINSLDYEKNNILHIAGMLPLSSQLDFIASAAMQMQYELRWFKEVKKIVSPTLEKAKNKDGLTPHELFTKQHNELREKGEQWMKNTATSCTVVGALIITIMFAAAFTVPGGYQQETGFPIFLNKKLFKVFMICDCISLLSSSTSVLMFLAILTSRYAEKDFLIYLPIKMIIGLATLFLSIATMMIAFCAALVLMMRGQASIFISIVCVASLPVAFFVLMQSRLLIDVARSTFASNI